LDLGHTDWDVDAAAPMALLKMDEDTNAAMVFRSAKWGIKVWCWKQVKYLD